MIRACNNFNPISTFAGKRNYCFVFSPLFLHMPACQSVFSFLCCSAGQNLRFLLILSAFCCGWHVSGMTHVDVRHLRCSPRWNQPTQITLAWLWPVFFATHPRILRLPRGAERRIKQTHAAVSLCSKYPFSTFYKCAVFIIRNPTTKKASSLGERNGKWQGVGVGWREWVQE